MDMGEFYLSSRVPSYFVMSESSGRPYYVSSRPSVVELLVPMCCTKCEEKVRESLLELDGLQRLVVDATSQRVTVTGFVDPLRTLKKARKVKKYAQLLSGDDRSMASPKRHFRCEYGPSNMSSYSGFVQPASEHHASSHWHSPQSYGYHHEMRPSYDEMVITNPCYVEHAQAPAYWSY